MPDTATNYVEGILRERLEGLERKRAEAEDRVAVAKQNVETFEGELEVIDQEIAKVKTNLGRK